MRVFSPVQCDAVFTLKITHIDTPGLLEADIVIDVVQFLPVQSEDGSLLTGAVTAVAVHGVEAFIST